VNVVEVNKLPKKIYVRVTCVAVNSTRKSYEKSLDVIAAELFKLPAGKGAEFTALAPEMKIRFGFVIDSDDLLEAGVLASGYARAALHAAGAATPNWKGSFEIIESNQKQLQDA
jgi:hypothetical protein